MRSVHKRAYIKRDLLILALLWNGTKVIARPAPDDGPKSTTAGLVTVVTTSGDKTIAETFTPTTVTISDLKGPLTAPTTILSTNSAGETLAIAVAAGAGAVAGGVGLAAWLFEPVPGGPGPPDAPPFPTSAPPPATSSSLESSSSSSSESSSSTSSEEGPSCVRVDPRFVTQGSQVAFTVPIPTLTTSSFSPSCTQSGDNKQLLRGTIPDYLNALAGVFCKKDLSKDESMTLGQTDLPDGNNFKNDFLQGIRVKFDFKFKNKYDGCDQNCVNAYGQTVTTCEYNSHVLYGGASLEQGCGTYSFLVDADPITKLECAPPVNPIYTKYAYRDAALNAIDDFCTAQDGKVLESGKSPIQEVAITAAYASNCTGSGSYKIDKTLCQKYLKQTIDSCDTDTTNYKHGGTVTDIDNCGAFTFHPTGQDIFKCYPDNKNSSWISPDFTYTTVSPDIANDAIEQFCDRQGAGQTFTLDPANAPPQNGFIQDTCKAPGMAQCAYFYTGDGKRVPDGSGVGDLQVSLQAVATGTSSINCSPAQKYAIQGQRCKQMMQKVVGIEPKGMCVGTDPKTLSLGSFLEAGDKGCVLWNMWAIATHN